MISIDNSRTVGSVGAVRGKTRCERMRLSVQYDCATLLKEHLQVRWFYSQKARDTDVPGKVARKSFSKETKNCV
jgi:hypothetical protein